MSSGGRGGGEVMDGGGGGRLLTKLHNAIQAQKFYEAHQLMKVINFRYTSAKKLPELECLLNKTGITLLDYEQFESGSDIGIMLAKLYTEHSLPVTPDRIGHAVVLVQKMQSSPERQNFISNILEWCGSSDVLLSGKFNAAVTEIYMKETSFPEAWKHLIRMSDSDQISAFTFSILGALNIPKSEWDLVIAQLILSLIHNGKRLNLAQDCYENLLKRIEGQPSPLLNGVRFLIEAAKRNDPKSYKSIKQVYWPSFNRESNLHRLVDSIGKSVFKLQDSNSRNGFMSNIMSALMAGEEGETGHGDGGSGSLGGQGLRARAQENHEMGLDLD